MQNFVNLHGLTIKRHNAFYTPVGAAKVSYVDETLLEWQYDSLLWIMKVINIMIRYTILQVLRRSLIKTQQKSSLMR